MMLPLIITLMSRSILFEDTSTWQGCMTSVNLCTLIIVGGPDVSGCVLCFLHPSVVTYASSLTFVTPSPQHTAPSPQR